MEAIQSRERLKKFVKREITQIEKPGNPGQVYRFADPESLVDILLDFLAFPVEELTVQRLEPSFWNALEPVLAEDLPVKSLPDCVERLAATFESFLKKIAFVRYGSDVVRWSGDGVTYVGLVNTMLAELIRGIVGKTKAGALASDLSAPIVDSRGTKGAVYGKVRDVRNNVHRSQDYTLAEIIALARTVLASYLLAVEDNKLPIEQTIYPQYRYLQKAVDAFRRWERQYVELEGQEERFMPDIGVLEPVAIEWGFDSSLADEENDRNQQEQSLPSSDSESSDEMEFISARRRGPISKFVEEYPRLAIIGGGGCGKTTTLQRLVFEQAQRLLTNPSKGLPIPVLIEANRYSRTFRFLDLVQSELGVDIHELEKLLNDGKLALFLDGLNEIAAPLQSEAFVELRNLLEKWPKPRVIVSSRKSGYQNVLGMSTFELQELRDEQIERFLVLSFADPQLGRSLFATLRTNSRLTEWARNPLLLRMLTKVAGAGSLPQNLGQMLKQFVSWILSRERKIRPTNVETKEDVLSHLAFHMRKAGNVSVQKVFAIELLREKLVQLSPSVGVNDLFQELVENQLLKKTEHDEVRFFHELIQEYFAARELTKLFLLDASSLAGLVTDSKWEQPIILMTGFLADKEHLVEILCRNNLLLAAKCVVPLRAEFPNLCDLVRLRAAEGLEKVCADAIRQGWIKTNILREIAGTISLLQDEALVRRLWMRLPAFSIVYYDAVLDGLTLCETSVLHRIFLDPEIFETRLSGRKRGYLFRLWFRIVEDVALTGQVEQAIKLCSRVGSVSALQAACAFDPDLALREIDPSGLKLGAKSLRKIFSLVDAEKHGAFLRKVFSEADNPLRFAAALRLATVKDESALTFLIDRSLFGDNVEKGPAFASLGNWGKDRISRTVFDLLVQGAVSFEQLADSPLLTYVELTDQLVGASPDIHSYISRLLQSGVENQVKSALSWITKLGVGHLFREVLAELIRSYRFRDDNPPTKLQKGFYEALKGERFQGVIMRFDPRREIGSIWCDETLEFYFLRQDQIWDRDPVELYDVFEFEVATGPSPKKDFKAVRVSKLPRAVVQGTIERLVPERRFGFIRVPPEEKMVFFHFDNVLLEKGGHITPGARVSFVLAPRLREPWQRQAVRVRLV